MTTRAPAVLTKTKVVPRLRGALLRNSTMSSKQCGGKGEERGRVYPDKEAAVERLLQPPGYMRGRPLKIILNSLDLRFPSPESYNQVVQLRRSLFVKVLSSSWREELVRLKMQPGLSSPETGGWSWFPEFRSWGHCQDFQVSIAKSWSGGPCLFSTRWAGRTNSPSQKRSPALTL